MDILKTINDRNFIITKGGNVGAKLNKEIVKKSATFFETLHEEFYSDEGDHAIVWLANRLFYSSLEKLSQTRKREVDFTNNEYVTKLATACFYIAAKFLAMTYPPYDELRKVVSVEFTQKELKERETEILQLHDFEIYKTTPGQLVELLVHDLEASRSWRDIYRVLNYIPFIHVLVFHGVAMQVAASLVALEQLYGFQTEAYSRLLASRLGWNEDKLRELQSVAEEVAEIFREVFKLPPQASRSTMG